MNNAKIKIDNFLMVHPRLIIGKMLAKPDRLQAIRG